MKISWHSALVFFCCLLFSAGELSAQAPLHVSGKWIKNNRNQKVVLRGVALADLDAIYKGDRSHKVKTTYKEIIDLACSEGWYIDIIRLTVHPGVVDETGKHGWLNYTPDFYFKNILDPVVKYANSKGKYVIIDWHYVGIDWTLPDVKKNTEAFWDYIAPRYAKNPGVLFELFNEPGDGMWTSWQQTAQGWVDRIRKKHRANNLIIIGGPYWCQVLPKDKTKLLKGKNLVYTSHIYPAHCRNGIPDWIEYVSSVAPVIITEWGYENNAAAGVTIGTAGKYGQLFHDYVNSKENVGWIAWCFDYVYRSTMFDAEWKLLGRGQSTKQTRYHDTEANCDRFETTADDTYENYMGEFTRTWLAEFKDMSVK